MGGPAKRRALAENNSSSSSDDQSSSRDAVSAVSRASPRSIPRLDGNRDPIFRSGNPVDYMKATDLKNISDFLGMAGWATARGFEVPSTLPQRPEKFNHFGREAVVALNTYNVIQAPNVVVHQYDISWGQNTDPTKRVLVKKIWASRAVKDALGEPANLWVYDGNKLAWCGKKLDRAELRVSVDLDEEENRNAAEAGRPVKNRRDDKKNVHQLFVRHTREVDIYHLQAFLKGQAQWSTECIDIINFLDHVMRAEPSRKYTQIKKSFFQRGEQRFDLGGGIEAFKGVFSSLRPVLNDRFEKGLSVNVDVANGTFWRAQELSRSIQQVFNCSLPQFQSRFKDAKKDWNKSIMKKDLAKFKRVGVTDLHNAANPTQWTIDSIVGKDAFEATFPDPEDRSQQISVAQYFKKKYNFNCAPSVPVVKMTKKIRGGDVYLPLECLKIDSNQRYNTKLSDVQTSNMIKFAVTLPAQRKQAVEFGVGLLDWHNDPYLRQYGIKVNPTPSKVRARVLPSPSVNFGPAAKPVQIQERDLIQGRWRLDGKKFIAPNVREIAAWGVCVIQGRGAVNKEQVEAFMQNFVRIYEGHGGRFNAKFKRPFICPGNLADGGELIQKAFNMTGNHFNSRPMFMVFIVNDRNADVYRRIKKSCDCRFGIPSQVLQSKHVAGNQAQYISNVCMKVNAKLGGCTTFIKSAVIPKVAPKSLGIPTMVIGADVSHPAPGAGSDEKASYAAITVSKDATFTRYWAQCQTNGNRVEMVTTQNIHDHLGNMAKRWITTIGKGSAPQRVLYIRDGVSEGQYAAVLDEEVRDMKETFMRLGSKTVPRFTVLIAGKRHHIRFFPEKGDRNGNPIPGTLVETGCTHPFEFDFYLCAHVAIKGTARPIHYQCILNDGKWEAAELQSFIFEHSYQYVRSTTPVSLHPAVYYAHLAADRSRAHTNVSPISSGKKEAKAQPPPSSTGSTSKASVETRPLTPMANTQDILDTMWFV